MTFSESALQEYQALRAEIISQFERRNSRLTVVWASIAALVTAAALTNLPELAIIGLLLTNSGWMDELRWYDHMVRIGAYIRVIIEPHFDGLQWETMNNEALPPPKKGRYSLISTLFSTYSLFSFTSIIVSIFLFILLMPINYGRVVFFVVLLAIGFIFTIINFVKAMNQPQRGKHWDEVFRSISNPSSTNNE